MVSSLALLNTAATTTATAASLSVCRRSAMAQLGQPRVTLAASAAAVPAPAPASPDRASGKPSSSSSSVPKKTSFTISRLSRTMREPSLLDKTEAALSDRCSRLEGEEAFDCWEALFEFENLKEERQQQCSLALPAEERKKACLPLERLENLVRQSNGLSSLIASVRMLAKARKASAEQVQQEEGEAKKESELKVAADLNSHRSTFPEPGAFPPTAEDLEVEKSALMPESSFTRLLRIMGHESPWFTHPSDFEYD